MILDNTLTSCTYTDRQWELLRKHLSRCTVDNLCTRGLMVFPHCLNEYKKEFREQSVCEIVDDKISTGNIVGFVGIEENNERVELSIRSCFQNEGKDDYFLHYMLQKVFNVAILDLKHSTADGDAFDFAMYLFPYYLKRAIKQGLFKQYCKCEYNDANVRGAIDVSRHIRHNIPFNGRIAYRTSEYKYDNAVTQLHQWLSWR